MAASSSSASLNLLVPVAAWPVAPRHEISALCVTTQARSAVVTGSHTGQLCVWSVESAAAAPHTAEDNNQLRLSPRAVLLGHTSPVLWTARCLFDRSDALVSLCSGGLLNVWDPMDGRCLCSPASPLLGTATAATSGAILPGLTHVAVGGEGPCIAIVQLASMAVRSVIAGVDYWVVALAATDAGAEQPRASQLVCLDGEGVLRAWLVSIDPSNAAVDVCATHLVSEMLPPPMPTSPSDGSSSNGNPATLGRTMSEAEAKAKALLEGSDESPWASRRAMMRARNEAARNRGPKRNEYDDEPVYEPSWLKARRGGSCVIGHPHPRGSLRECKGFD